MGGKSTRDRCSHIGASSQRCTLRHVLYQTYFAWRGIGSGLGKENILLRQTFGPIFTAVYARQVFLVGDNFLSCEAYYLAGKCLNQHRREGTRNNPTFGNVARFTILIFHGYERRLYSARNTEVDLSNREFLLSDRIEWTIETTVAFFYFASKYAVSQLLHNQCKLFFSSYGKYSLSNSPSFRFSIMIPDALFDFEK